MDLWVQCGSPQWCLMVYKLNKPHECYSYVRIIHHGCSWILSTVVRYVRIIIIINHSEIGVFTSWTRSTGAPNVGPLSDPDLSNPSDLFSAGYHSFGGSGIAFPVPGGKRWNCGTLWWFLHHQGLKKMIKYHQGLKQWLKKWKKHFFFLQKKLKTLKFAFTKQHAPTKLCLKILFSWGNMTIKGIFLLHFWTTPGQIWQFGCLKPGEAALQCQREIPLWMKGPPFELAFSGCVHIWWKSAVKIANPKASETYRNN